MKKAFLVAAVIGLAMPGFSQEKYVVSANMALQANNLDEAKENIDKAFENADTREKPKSLFVRGEVYMQIQEDVNNFVRTNGTKGSGKYKDINPYREGVKAFMKLVEVKADYEKDNVNSGLFYGANLEFNDGIKAYKDKNYEEAAELMKTVVKIRDIGGGKRFEGTKMGPALDTIAARALLMEGNAYYVQKKYDDAIPLLAKAAANPVTKSASTYACLVDAYTQVKKPTEAAAAIQEGRKAFPDDAILRNDELNSFRSAGKVDEMVKKLEDAVKNDPNNIDLQINLAGAYLDMANPKDGKKPANADELNKKCEAAYQSALKIAPDNMVVNYNFGVFYYEQARVYNEQMKGVPDDDQKKYDELKGKRDGLFTQALPLFEKAYNVAQAGGKVKDEDINTYRSTMQALNSIYAAQSKNDKAAEMKAKLDALH